MASGIFTIVLELVVYPAIDELWKWHFEMKSAAAQPQLARSSRCRRQRRRADRAQTRLIRASNNTRLRAPRGLIRFIACS
jgi:hypothetical protein